MTRYQRKALAAQAKRDDARAETLVRLGPSARAYDGTPPAFIGDRAVFGGRECGWNTRMRAGTTERKRGGGTRFVPPRRGPPGVMGGGARLAAGEWIETTADGERIAHTSRVQAAVSPEGRIANVTAFRDATRCGGGPVTVQRGEENAAPIVREIGPGVGHAGDAMGRLNAARAAQRAALGEVQS